MFLNIQETYNTIEKDFIDNQKDIFNLLNLYTRKYAYLSDRINNVNTGLFLNDNRQPVAQIYIKNKTGYIKTHLIFNKEGNRILDKEVINFKLN